MYYLRMNLELSIFRLIPFLALIVLTGLEGAQAGENKKTEKAKTEVVATAQGIQVTSKDVQAVKRFFEQNTPYRTSDEQYVQKTLEMKLFAREALENNLVKDEYTQMDQDSPKALYMYSQLYLDHLLGQYQLDPLVIESYYNAFPRRFLKKDEDIETGQKISADQVVPLQKVGDKIKKHILRSKLKKIRSQAFEDLKEKYAADIH